MPPSTARNGSAAGCEPSNQRVVLLLNGRDGTFDTRVNVPTPGGPGNLVLSDVTRDGKPDILVDAGGDDGRTWVLVNKGTK